jgi:hypothetical protein
MSGLVSQSICAAEYCISGSYIKKVFNEMLGYYSDRPLTIPIGIDSQSTMDTAQSPKETSRTRYMAWSFHYVRHCVGNRIAKTVQSTGDQ